MKKKGELAAKELLGLILVILVVGTIIAITVKGCQAPNLKAKESFLSMINDLNSLQEHQHENSLLILEEETALAYFPLGKSAITVVVDGWAARDYEVVFRKPKAENCGNETACFCLLRELSYQDTGGEVTDLQATVIAAKAVCEPIKTPLTLDNCGIGQEKDVVSYTCQDGFVIERLVIDMARDEIKYINNDAHFRAPSRLSLKSKRENNKIELSTE